MSRKGSASVTRAATLVGEEANDDLALIKVDPSGLGLKPLTLTSKQDLDLGTVTGAGVGSDLLRSIEFVTGHAPWTRCWPVIIHAAST